MKLEYASVEGATFGPKGDAMMRLWYSADIPPDLKDIVGHLVRFHNFVGREEGMSIEATYPWHQPDGYWMFTYTPRFYGDPSKLVFRTIEDIVKVTTSFVERLEETVPEAKIVKAMLDEAKDLGMVAYVSSSGSGASGPHIYVSMDIPYQVKLLDEEIKDYSTGVSDFICQPFDPSQIRMRYKELADKLGKLLLIYRADYRLRKKAEGFRVRKVSASGFILEVAGKTLEYTCTDEHDLLDQIARLDIEAIKKEHEADINKLLAEQSQQQMTAKEQEAQARKRDKLARERLKKEWEIIGEELWKIAPRPKH